MTQMLLFETPSVPNPSETPAIAAAVSQPQEPVNVAAALEHDSGLHHMGDLARLVLLRYDLVAKRRARMAARRAAAKQS